MQSTSCGIPCSLTLDVAGATEVKNASTSQQAKCFWYEHSYFLPSPNQGSVLLKFLVCRRAAFYQCCLVLQSEVAQGRGVLQGPHLLCPCSALHSH